uniref:GST C-terminal domain-containing protein n=1 Tax=Glossina pallidipes TaxID=7398 RepID=A0A1A9Z6F5_GLOPL
MVLLNEKLLNCTYLVGERITLADIIVFCSLPDVAVQSTARKPYGSASRWFMTLLNQSQFRAVLKGFKMHI